MLSLRFAQPEDDKPKANSSVVSNNFTSINSFSFLRAHGRRKNVLILLDEHTIYQPQQTNPVDVPEKKKGEKSSMEMLNILQKAISHICIITLKDPTQHVVTEEKLISLGLEFPKNGDVIPTDLEVSKFTKQPAYKNNVLYCNGIDPGICVKEFIWQKGLDTRKILFVSQSKDNLVNMQCHFTEPQFEFIGLHYVALNAPQNQVVKNLSIFKPGDGSHLQSASSNANKQDQENTVVFPTETLGMV